MSDWEPERGWGRAGRGRRDRWAMRLRAKWEGDGQGEVQGSDLEKGAVGPTLRWGYRKKQLCGGF